MRFSAVAAQALALSLVAAAPAVDKRGNCDKTTTKVSSSSSSAAVKSASTSSAAAAAAVVSTNPSSSSNAAAVAAASSSSSSSTAAAVVTSTTIAAAAVAAVTSTSSSAPVVVATTTTSSSTSIVTPTIVPSVGSYTYQLCAIEPTVNGVSTRLLTGQQEQGQAAMTVESCASWCSGYTYFGVEYGAECYCGNTITNGATVDTSGGCNMVCDGNSGEYCGGSWRMELYALGSAGSVSLPATYSATAAATATGTGTATAVVAASSATATGSASLNGWESVGCVIEPFDNGGSGRGLTGQSIHSSAMTLEVCAAYCVGYDYFGVEYYDECYCGDYLAANTALDTASLCAYPCAGNSAESCGGSGHFSLYQLSNETLVSLPTYTVPAAVTTSTAAVVATTTSAPAVVIGTTSTAAAVVAAVSTTSAPAVVVAVSTSSIAAVVAAASSSSSGAAAVVAAAATTTKAAAAVTTLSTATSVKAAGTSITASTCSAPSSTASVTALTSTILGVKFQYNHYYSGSGYMLSTSNPGNTLPSLLPPVTIAVAGSNCMSTAAQTCIAKAGILSAVYKSFDLHYRTDTCAWECVLYPGTNTVTSYFNVASNVVSTGHGFSC